MGHCSCNHCHTERKRKISPYLLPAISFGMLLGGIAMQVAEAGFFDPTVRFIWYALAYLPVGLPVMKEAIESIREKEIFSEFTLMCIATLGAFYIGEYPEGVAVMLFYSVGELFQENALSKARKNISALLDVRPETAVVIRDNERVPLAPADVIPGEIIEVKAGERVPLDGKLLSGAASFNTAALTGESVPRTISPNENVLAGMIVTDKVIRLEVTKPYNQSALARILELVQNASERKAPAELFIRKFARIYTPIVTGLAFLIVLIPYLYSLVQPDFLFIFNDWLYRALVFLVISCPCALVLSVPLTFFSSIGKASKSGILIKGGNYLEALTNISAVVFDKTGTLTKGKFKIDRLEAQNGNEDELLKTAKIGEFYSNHPIGKALVSYGSIDINEEYIEGYKELSGFGVLSYYEGKMILIGNYKLMKEYKIEAEEKNYAGTVLYVAQDNVFLGYIYISDEIKEDSPSTIEGLRKSGIQSYMLTGDSNKIGTVVGEKLGLNSENIYSQLLPQDKVNKLEEIKSKNNKGIVFVGDGVNDAPVLSLADVGIAMGGVGSDIAIEAADVVIMKDEPSKILELLKIAKQNKKVVMQNIIMALGIKVIVMILGVFGIANMWMAIFSDVGVSLLAVLNASQGIKRN